MNNPLITVFTPTFNRVDFLPKVYSSLKKQEYRDFEWLIVDDGSSDNTETVINDFILEDEILIHYIKQPNSGKHKAINKGVSVAKGELFLILDSDDTLPKDSLLNINQHYVDIKDNSSIGGVCGLMAHHDGTIIGERKISSSMNLSSIEMRYKYGFVGDVCEVFKTDVLREFPFPEIENEKFCPEALVWNRIATKYKLHYFNEVIYYRDYLDDGLTSKIVRIRMNSPIASMICYAELNQLDIPFKDKFKAAINYWRFRLCYNGSGSYPKLFGLWNAIAPLGWLMHLNDIRVNKRQL
ncbi:glycosyltransferase, group 2 family protein [Prevotella sp. oral taxon 306 str. F0472]|uniref:glycosyltransferase family 2 protein n=1 Tax=Prevotella sp. oral taxon 306 TaxID=712461 RepID=UPI00025BBF7D|nr:glycosyltransferase family A protein [Prevotella sp. oral taxon 306]EID32337.1 glycosyltransferase, group 2 family protein [Prevotella sp. oral taxon 306 str. F0472]